MSTKTKFVLTLTIEGESLESIDDALVRAGGERLMSRMTNPPMVNGESLLKRSSKPKAEVRVEEIETPAIRALKAVFKACGESAAKLCLEAFGVKRISELKEDQNEGFIEYCNNKLGEKSDGKDQPIAP